MSAHRYQGTHQAHAALAPEDVGGQVSPICHSHVLLCLMVANSVPTYFVENKEPKFSYQYVFSNMSNHEHDPA